MGDTIHLDPLDVQRLTAALGTGFSGLLEEGIIGLHTEEGLVLPHLAMDPVREACVLLGEDGRCTRHEARPGLCRLYPLGREYTDGGLQYFLTEHECPEGPMSKVRIRDWLGMEDIRRYETYLCEWHALTGRQKRLCTKAVAAGRTELARRRSMQLLETFYLSLPETEESFYLYFEQCLRQRPWTAAGGDR